MSGRSSQKCKKCSRTNHTLLHVDSKVQKTNRSVSTATAATSLPVNPPNTPAIPLVSAPVYLPNLQATLNTVSVHFPSTLNKAMSYFFIFANDCHLLNKTLTKKIKVRTLLDTETSTSIVSQKLVNRLRLHTGKLIRSLVNSSPISQFHLPTVTLGHCQSQQLLFQRYHLNYHFKK